MALHVGRCCRCRRRLCCGCWWEWLFLCGRWGGEVRERHTRGQVQVQLFIVHVGEVAADGQRRRGHAQVQVAVGVHGWQRTRLQVAIVPFCRRLIPRQQYETESMPESYVELNQRVHAGRQSAPGVRQAERRAKVEAPAPHSIYLAARVAAHALASPWPSRRQNATGIEGTVKRLTCLR